ncbi:MAG: hypothetical protein HY738_02000 [Bacteroidia bacterium]|nr:hypothetical protein [Bacteroidia bacterium]
MENKFIINIYYIKERLVKHKVKYIKPNHSFKIIIINILLKVIDIFFELIYVPKDILLSKFIYNESYYLANNPEVSELVKEGKMKASEHWRKIGVNKGLVANSMFNVIYYLNNNLDLKEYFQKDYKGAAKHWLE